MSQPTFSFPDSKTSLGQPKNLIVPLKTKSGTSSHSSDSKMIAILTVAIASLGTGHSECFFPKMMPPFPVGLSTKSNVNTTTAPTTAPTNAPTSAPSASPTESDTVNLEEEIVHLEEWTLSYEEHIVQYFNDEVEWEEFIECASDSAIHDVADGVGSSLNIREHAYLVNTIHDLVSEYSIKHGSAEYIDDHTIEITFVTKAKCDFGILRWMSGFNEDWKSETELTNIVHILYDDNGMIQKLAVITPGSRKFIEFVLSVYTTTTGPIAQDLGPTGKLTIFGYNAIVVILLALISVLTTLVGFCVFISMRVCTRHGSERVVYKKVEIVTDTEMELDQ